MKTTTASHGTFVAADRDEERFLFKLSFAMAVVLVAGFSVNVAMGRSSFEVPVIYHVHAAVFFSWIVLFLAQSGLVASGNVTMHRRLGWLSVLWVPVMVVLGTMMTVSSLRLTGGPFFFDANEFLISNPIGLAAFAGLVAGAIFMRRRTDWHRRLMISGMASITGPGFGRLLPTPLMGAWAWEIVSAVGMVFIVIGMVRDHRKSGRVHPAWFVGLAAGIGWIVLGEVLAYTEWGIELTQSTLAGYPGASRPMGAYSP